MAQELRHREALLLFLVGNIEYFKVDVIGPLIL